METFNLSDNAMQEAPQLSRVSGYAIANPTYSGADSRRSDRYLHRAVGCADEKRVAIGRPYNHAFTKPVALGLLTSAQPTRMLPRRLTRALVALGLNLPDTGELGLRQLALPFYA